MVTHKIHEALSVLGECVDAKLADAARFELQALLAAAEAERASLRDTFAAAALTGIASRGALTVEAGAALAYHYSDAMLKARESK